MSFTPKKTKIDFWFGQILLHLKWENKILKFSDLIILFKDEIISPEHIFIYLHKYKYLCSFHENVQMIRENLEAGIPASMNNLQFHVDHEEAYNYIKQYPDMFRPKDREPGDQNQLTLNL